MAVLYVLMEERLLERVYGQKLNNKPTLNRCYTNDILFNIT
ncbi:hypothetical protein LDG_6987 [Legionella drancourtii LLAP12]|uniref:Uncharacterized protein n=1 Tax=Legionella drancourtii LLAP12 TaxID=658187 RepID=G9EP07_9GAMM|nr:hypothetical protein LDG_6987 [Legionella drancourtii LLAP12]